MAFNTGIRKHSKKAPDLEGETIEIVVSAGGDPRRTRHVHKDLICASSKCFRVVVEHNRTEDDGAFDLQCESGEEVFDLYIKWLYLGIIFSEEDKDLHMDGDGEEHDSEWTRLANLYALGEYVEDRSFRNAVMDGMCQKFIASPASRKHVRELSALAYDNTEEFTSRIPFRKFCADMCARIGDEDWLGDAIFGYHCARTAFYEDVIVRMFQFRNAGSDENQVFPWVNDRCRYHKHGRGESGCTDEPS